MARKDSEPISHVWENMLLGREGGYSEHFVAEFIKDIKYLTIKEQFLIIDVMIIFFFQIWDLISLPI